MEITGDGFDVSDFEAQVNENGAVTQVHLEHLDGLIEPNSLAARVLASDKTLAQLDDELFHWVESFRFTGKFRGRGGSRAITLGGNSVHFDLKFIEKYLPKFASCLNHRLLDVSAISESVYRMFPEAYENRPKKNYAHGAEGDILESIQEYKYYQEFLKRMETQVRGLRSAARAAAQHVSATGYANALTTHAAQQGGVQQQHQQSSGARGQKRSYTAMAGAPADSTELSFGKHQGRTFSDIMKNERGYCKWAMSLENPGGGVQALRAYLEAHGWTKDSAPPRASAASSSGRAKPAAAPAPSPVVAHGTLYFDN